MYKKTRVPALFPIHNRATPSPHTEPTCGSDYYSQLPDTENLTFVIFVQKPREAFQGVFRKAKGTSWEQPWVVKSLILTLADLT